MHQTLVLLLLFHNFVILGKNSLGTDGHGLDGREEASPLEGVTDDVIDKAVGCCCDTRPLLDRVMEKFLVFTQTRRYINHILSSNNYHPNFSSKIIIIVFFLGGGYQNFIFACLYRQFQEFAKADKNSGQQICTKIKIIFSSENNSKIKCSSKVYSGTSSAQT